jgi:predicted secreted Zn-dependent protease
MRYEKGRMIWLIVSLLLSISANAYGNMDIREHGADAAAPERISDGTVRTQLVETKEFYEIYGRSAWDLRCEIGKKGCLAEDGNIYDSITRWSWAWEYIGREKGTTCAPGDISIRMEIIYRYPKWVPEKDAPAELIDKWNAYLKNLMIHEEGHRDLAVRALEKFGREVSTLPADRSCTELDSLVRVLSRKYMKKLNAQAMAYDRETNHGVKQGAQLR